MKHSATAPTRSRALSSARWVASSKIGTSRTRRVSKSSETKLFLSSPRSPVAASFDDAERHQTLHCLADRRAGYFELLAEVAFGRHPRSRSEVANDDPSLELSSNLGTDGVPRDWIEGNFIHTDAPFSRDSLDRPSDHEPNRSSSAAHRRQRWSDQLTSASVFGREPDPDQSQIGEDR
jgi:hypothetical protein